MAMMGNLAIGISTYQDYYNQLTFISKKKGVIPKKITPVLPNI